MYNNLLKLYTSRVLVDLYFYDVLIFKGIREKNSFQFQNLNDYCLKKSGLFYIIKRIVKLFG